MSGWTAHDDAAHEKKSSESKRASSSKSRTLEDYKKMFKSFVDKNGRQPPPGMSEEEFIEQMATTKAYADGILTLPRNEDIERCMLRKARDEFYIDAAFRSIRTNEVFMFTGFHYCVVKYDAQSYSQKEKENHFTKSPLLLIDGFYELCGSVGFRDGGVDAAFGCHGTDEAFLFSRSYAAKIKYDSNNEGEVLELDSIRWLFMFLEDSKFSEGFFDAACESTVPDEAYLFKGSDYALINYSELTLIREGRITGEFTCLHNTLFESEIESAFASHTSNQLYFFKDNTYVLIEFDSKTKESRIIAGPEEIVPTNWPCLVGLVPYKYYKNPNPIEPKTWKPIWAEGRLERAPLANCSLETNSPESKRRKVGDYALDVTMTSGSSSKSMKTVEDQCYMQRRPRYSSHYIDAAFRSIRVNEVFMFTRCEYFVVKYNVDSRKVKNVTKAPLLLTDGFRKLYGTRFSTDGVDAAFGCHGTNTAFLFSGSWIAKIKYDLDKEGRVVELKDGVEGMFPFLKDTKLFSQGYLNAACESTVPGEAYLFKGSDYALINYSKLILIREDRITDEFTCLHSTLFESEIGSVFASHTSNQLYFFKDNIYVLIEFDSETKESRIIAGPEEIVPTSWPCLKGLLPYKKDIGPDSDGQKFVPGPSEVSLEYTDPFDDSPFGDLCRRLCDFGPHSST